MRRRPGGVTALILLLAGGRAFAVPQGAAAAPPAAEQVAAPAPPDAAPAKEERGQLAVAPLPVVDPSIGNGFAGVVLYTLRLDRNDKVSPPSTFGGAGVYTSSGSWGIGGGGKFYLKQDRFRIAGVGMTGRANYDFYGIGNQAQEVTIPITQKASGLLVDGQVRAFEKVFVGARYYYFKVTTGLGDTTAEAPEAIKDVEFPLPVAMLALHLERDTTDSKFYPTSGSVVDSKIGFSTPGVGAQFTYQRYTVSFKQFLRLGSRRVLGYRVNVCAVDGQAPFFGLCSLGSEEDLRGYPMGRYRDSRMLVGQAELRGDLKWRFGYVVFAGAGEVAPSFSDLNWSNIRPGGGAGLRFAVDPKNRINIRMDFSVGQGSHAVYIGVGEAF